MTTRRLLTLVPALFGLIACSTTPSTPGADLGTGAEGEFTLDCQADFEVGEEPRVVEPGWRHEYFCYLSKKEVFDRIRDHQREHRENPNLDPCTDSARTHSVPETWNPVFLVGSRVLVQRDARWTLATVRANVARTYPEHSQLKLRIAGEAHDRLVNVDAIAISLHCPFPYER